MAKARAELGEHEVVGGENSRIIMYDSFTTLKASVDETPWCAAFLCYVFSGGTRSAAADSYLVWGQHLERFIPGCVIVTKVQEGHHVTLGVKEEGAYFDGLGGNERDAVSIVPFHKANVLAYRWPPGEALPAL